MKSPVSHPLIILCNTDDLLNAAKEDEGKFLMKRSEVVVREVVTMRRSMRRNGTERSRRHGATLRL